MLPALECKRVWCYYVRFIERIITQSALKAFIREVYRAAIHQTKPEVLGCCIFVRVVQKGPSLYNKSEKVSNSSVYSRRACGLKHL